MTMITSALPPVLEDDFLAARRGDRDAFARLVRVTQAMVASVALAVTRDVQLSEDVAQETYLKAWQRLGSMQQAESFLPWLRQVTRNRAIDHVRRRRHQELALGDTDARISNAVDGGLDPDAWLQGGQQSQLLARALDAVPDDSREVLLLFYREGQSSRHVAALLGLSDGAVRKRLQRARDALQSELLAQVGEVARHSAPGLAFATLVVASLGPAEAGAATAATATAGKWALGAIGSVFAALAVVLGAVFWEVRQYVSRARNPVERRELLRHGIVYAALMASFVGVLFWSKHGAWTFTTLLAVSGVYALAIIGMGVRRARIHRRHRPQR
ncbi:RNA polymerase sigma factor [Lysobacter koreensis]|uniref:RNA polymerase sigma factor n=1 Tax=Lysobacter koreensis TaxID=266122 RepID=A0ABW2YLD0_9GAMM